MSTRKFIKRPKGYTAPNLVELVRGGKGYFDLLIQLIKEANDSIHLQTYIYAEDETGKQVANALIKAASRKVKIYLLVDGYASQDLAPAFTNHLKQSGINFRFFDPIFKSRNYFFGRRMHHKVTVIDSKYGLVGGINISDNYNDLPGKPAWLDFALYVKGEIVKELCILCWKSWNAYPLKLGPAPCKHSGLELDLDSPESCLVRMRRNDWVRGKNQVSGSYFEIFHQAKSQILIVSSYFLPGKLFRRKIAEAVKRGVSVKLVVAGISDVDIAKQAERYIYQWCFKNNIQIYEYRLNVLHGKMAVCDDKWITIGSYNVNNISAFASVELNLDVNNPQFASSVKSKVESIIADDCICITPDYFMAKNPFLKRIWQKICYETVRVLIFLFTFYFKHPE